jgi:hypothetical protein
VRDSFPCLLTDLLFWPARRGPYGLPRVFSQGPFHDLFFSSRDENCFHTEVFQREKVALAFAALPDEQFL